MGAIRPYHIDTGAFAIWVNEFSQANGYDLLGDDGEIAVESVPVSDLMAATALWEANYIPIVAMLDDAEAGRDALVLAGELTVTRAEAVAPVASEKAKIRECLKAAAAESNPRTGSADAITAHIVAVQKLVRAADRACPNRLDAANVRKEVKETATRLHREAIESIFSR